MVKKKIPVLHIPFLFSSFVGFFLGAVRGSEWSVFVGW